MGADVGTDRIEAALHQGLCESELHRNAERLAGEIAGMPSPEDTVTAALEQLPQTSTGN